MGVPGLWDILRPAGETRSLTHLAVTDGFEANPEGYRGFRVGIDASIWFFHAAYGKEGENPELRTLFFKCTRLMSAPFLPVFVFDGPKRPEIKRGKHISGNNHWLIQGMQEIINAFGFEWRIAPGEAEAELAYMNRVGVIDAVMTDDVDTFVFGAAMVVRNSSITLSGNRGHSLKNAAGKDDGNHAATYKLADITRHPDIQLTQGGLILIAILRGGDYHPAGLAGCGPAIAHGLARCGFGDSLLNAARTLSDEHLPGFLVAWRAEVREELRTNARGLLQRKNPTLAKALTDDFPNMEVLLSYTDPITSEPKGRTARNVNMDWQKEPDLGKIAGLCEMYFEWGVKEIIIKRFRTVLWPSAVLRILRRSVLIADKRKNRLVERDPGNMPVTPRKKGKQGRPTPPGTPSTMIAKHFSSLQLGSPSRSQGVESDDEEPADNLVVKIHSSRQHASTDGILEYRLEIAPQQLVHLCEEGVKGLRTALATGLEESDEEGGEDDEDGGNNRKTKAKKPPPDPLSHLRIWLPACMVRMVHPDLVDEFEGVRDRRQAKKAGKSAAGTSGAAASRA
ncbi:PIN domain-like protein, partial [Sparassis latifolia]